jgi:phosphorylase kinase alpha/beta subunit
MNALNRDRLLALSSDADAMVLARQHPVTGLLPASTATTVHGDYSHAWVRDNVYSVIGLWALSAAWRRQPDGAARADLYAQAVIKNMRGLLTCMMRQAGKVERFKASEDPLDSLHAKYDTATCEPVVTDDGWGHLQIDATSVFLLFLAQMTRSGLRIVADRAEADFVQNLVHYIGPAYRIADYGIWERGDKINDGGREINASSVGMAKAALEAMQGLDVFAGARGQAGIIHAMPDEIARARETLDVLLPLESISKETDGALLSIVGWPAFAVDDPRLVERTRDKIVEKLEGRYGAKRFLRDGHQTVAEDSARLHYQAGELARFENIESEWPLFFAYQMVDGFVSGDLARGGDYAARLKPLFVERSGRMALPELYIVPEEGITAELAEPGSQDRIPGENAPLLWAQSLWLTGELLRLGLVTPADIDPLKRRERPHRIKPEMGLNIVFLAEDDMALENLLALGASKATLTRNAGVPVLPSRALAHALEGLGANAALGLTGRPARRLGPLVTARAYAYGEQTVLFTPAFLDSHDFHFRYDAACLAERLRGEIRYCGRHWRDPSRTPVMTIALDRFETSGAGVERLRQVIADIGAGNVDGVSVRFATPEDAIHLGERIGLDFLSLDFETRPPDTEREAPCPSWSPDAPHPVHIHQIEAELAGLDAASLLRRYETAPSLSEKALVLCALSDRFGLAFKTPAGDTLRALFWGLYEEAGRNRSWRATRIAAAELALADPRLRDAAKDVIVRMKRLDFGPDTAIDADFPADHVHLRLVKAFGGGVKGVLAQEILLHIGALIKSKAELFRGISSIRLAEILPLVGGVSGEDGLADLAPHTLLDRLVEIMSHTPSVRALLSYQDGRFGLTNWQERVIDWRDWRAGLGVFTRVGEDFFPRVWALAGACDGLVIGDPLAPDARLDTQVLRSDFTPHERKFANRITARLDRIARPEYRTLTLEAMNAASLAADHHGTCRYQGDLRFDALIEAAVAALWARRSDDPVLSMNVQQAWANAYNTPADEMAGALYAVACNWLVERQTA